MAPDDDRSRRYGSAWGRSWALAVAAALAISACSADDTASTASSVSSGSTASKVAGDVRALLTGRAFIVATGDGTIPAFGVRGPTTVFFPVESQVYLVGFDDGCNIHQLSGTLTDDHLVIDNETSTAIGCDKLGFFFGARDARLVPLDAEARTVQVTNSKTGTVDYTLLDWTAFDPVGPDELPGTFELTPDDALTLRADGSGDVRDRQAGSVVCSVSWSPPPTFALTFDTSSGMSNASPRGDDSADDSHRLKLERL